MFCTNCGAQVDDGNAFCPTCGARLDHPALVNAQQADVPAGSARQALPATGAQQTQAVRTRPYASRSHARQTTPASSAQARAARRDRSGESARRVGAYAPSPARPSRNVAAYVALGAIALIATVALAVVRPFQGFSPQPEPAPVEVESITEPVVVETPAADDAITYIVQEGEDIAGVAVTFSVDPAVIRQLNNFGPDEQLKPGQVIKIPGSAL